MASRMLVGSRKGLLIFAPNGTGWEIAQQAFLGQPVSMAMHDPRDGALYAALNLGHFGAKLHRSEIELAGEGWNEFFNGVSLARNVTYRECVVPTEQTKYPSAF